MKIYQIQSKEENGITEFSGKIDDFSLWYRFPSDYGLPGRADAFLAACLLPAMKIGENIEIDPAYPVSPKLMRGIYQLQEIYKCWYPELKHIKVQARVEASEHTSSGIASFFSGGVDSSYTFLNHQKEISYLVFVKGVDIQVDNHDLYDEALSANARFAKHYQKTLVPVETNIRKFQLPYGFSWRRHIVSSGLGSIALALGFPIIYVAASETYYDMFIDGSHPVTDPLWSNESVQIVYDGGIRRSEKLKVIAQSPFAMKGLRVCWQDKGYNCGKCEKCMRTMLSLKLLGLPLVTFPPVDSYEAIKKWRIHDSSQKSFFLDLLELAREKGDKETLELLRFVQRKDGAIRRLVQLDKVLLRGQIKPIFTKIIKRKG